MIAPAGVVDTSVFIAAETGRAVNEALLPGTSYVSVVSIAELSAGVLAAVTVEQRARRLRTLTAVSKVPALPIDRSVALTWATLRAQLAESGRRVNVNDLWIAATALVQRLPLYTQDADFDPLDGISGLTVVRV